MVPIRPGTGTLVRQFAFFIRKIMSPRILLLHFKNKLGINLMPCVAWHLSDLIGKNIKIWRVPKIWVITPKSWIFIGCSIINHWFWGTHLWKPPNDKRFLVMIIIHPCKLHISRTIYAYMKNIWYDDYLWLYLMDRGTLKCVWANPTTPVLLLHRRGFGRRRRHDRLTVLV